VVLASSKEECDVVQGYKLGVNSYIVKPVDFEQLSEVVEHLANYRLELIRRPENVLGATTDHACV
jgi:two-component system, response regulator